ncbi:MAG TPA: hypothetical protein VNZ86_15695 [Bacteroidia bacterium]|nr:hypothetical protein [Bacteroidia bacterium]
MHKPAFLRTLSLVLLFALTWGGCSFQKRVYTGGYYYNHSSAVTTNDSPNKGLSIQASDPVFSASAAKDQPSAYSLLLPASSPLPPNPQPCDTIFMNNGEKLLGVVTEVGAEQVKYRICDYQDGPVHILHKKRVASIHYASGLIRDLAAEKKKSTGQSSIPGNSSQHSSGTGDNSYLEVMVRDKAESAMDWSISALIALLVFPLLTLPLALIARFKAKRALNAMKGNAELESRYYRTAHRALVTANVVLVVMIVLLLFFILFLALLSM